jgi:hypothetical protein
MTRDDGFNDITGEKWEVLPRVSFAGRFPARMRLTISKARYLSWNKPTQEALGDPSHVVIVYNDKERLIGVRKCNATDPHAHHVTHDNARGAGWTVSAVGTLREAGLTPKATFSAVPTRRGVALQIFAVAIPA